MFNQAQECIKSIQRYCKYDFDICVLALELIDEERDWLEQHGVILSDNYKGLPTFKGAPSYVYAQTCRPYLRELFSGYSIYMWLDADIRITDSSAFEFYIGNAQSYRKAVIIAMEIDDNYIFVRDPESALLYHSEKNRRMLEVYGVDTASRLQYLYYFNTGIFAMSHESLIWDRFNSNLLKSLSFPYDGIREQDAMNVAIVDSGMNVGVAPSVMNWICSASLPLFEPSIGKWVQPSYPYAPISVLHLTMSNTLSDMNGEKMTYYEYYKRNKLTE
jgi:hypothetical protein